MKLPSFSYITGQAGKSLNRFPEAIISACAAVAAAISLIDDASHISQNWIWINVMLSAALGIPLFFCARIISEGAGMDRKKKVIIISAVSVLLLLVYVSLPVKESTFNTSIPYIRYVLYAITAHLFVSFAPFLRKKSLNGFWQFNKILFIRVGASALYSSVIYVGLLLALVALKLLFDININDKFFGELFVIIAGVFNTWFFLSGAPEDIEALEQSFDYPKGLKIFSQYVLLSLLILYFIILYAYGAKILISGNWPRGVVSYLIICVSILGNLTILLLYPFSKENPDSFISKLSRYFYVALFPLLLLLFMSIFMRIGDYGITINRYCVLVLGIWISVVCFFSLFRGQGIKFIPVSLAFFCLVISFGPWGVFSVSERSQVKRLQNIFEESGIMKNGKIINGINGIVDTASTCEISFVKFPNDTLLNDSMKAEVKSIMDYLDSFHGMKALSGWYAQDIDSLLQRYAVLCDDHKYADEAAVYFKAAGLNDNFVYNTDGSPMDNLFYANANSEEKTMSVKGYDYLVDFSQSTYPGVLATFRMDSLSTVISYSDSLDNRIIVSVASEKIDFPLDSFFTGLRKKYSSVAPNDVPVNEMILSSSSSSYAAEIHVYHLTLNRKKEKDGLDALTGRLLIRKK